jgi:hypothetical protein
MDKSVSDAQDAFSKALGGNDLGAINDAEAQLEQAVLNRYNTEINMVRQLQAAIESAKQSAYEFSVQMAQRINAVGGSPRHPRHGAERARGAACGIGGTDNVPGQITNLQNYVGAIDTWYNRRAAAIQHDVQQQAPRRRPMRPGRAGGLPGARRGGPDRARAREAVAQLADQLTKQIDDDAAHRREPGFRRRAPADGAGRRGAAGRPTRRERPGAHRCSRRYADSLQTELGLLGDVFQRPSPEYQAVYNDIISQLTAVRDQAQTEGDRAEDLQAQLVMLQQQANSIGQASFDVQAATDAAMSGLNQEALGYYEYAEQEGQRLYALQVQQQQELLDTITHGMDPNLFIAHEAERGGRSAGRSATRSPASLGLARPPRRAGTGTTTGNKPHGQWLTRATATVLKDQPVQLMLNEKVFAEFTPASCATRSAARCCRSSSAASRPHKESMYARANSALAQLKYDITGRGLVIVLQPLAGTQWNFPRRRPTPRSACQPTASPSAC